MIGRSNCCLGPMLGLLGLLAASAPALAMEKPVFLLTDRDGAEAEGALVDDGALWLPAAGVELVTGFKVEPRGLCAGELCIPVPAGEEWMRSVEGETYYNMSRLAGKLEQQLAASSDEAVWSFSPVPQLRQPQLQGLQAPDFTLSDREGKPVRLSDFRGRKVLLLTWASW